MHIDRMIPMLLVVAFLVVLTWWQRRRYGIGKLRSAEDKSDLHEGASALATSQTFVPAGVLVNDVWWQHLSNLHQLKVARKALLVWESFAGSQMLSYRAGSAGPLTIIETDMLPKALEEIDHYAQDRFPGTI